MPQHPASTISNFGPRGRPAIPAANAHAATSRRTRRRNTVERPVHQTNDAGLSFGALEIVITQRFSGPGNTATENRRQGQCMIAGLSVQTRALAARIGRDHPTDRCAIRCRTLGREEQAVRLEGGVQLVLDHTRLYVCPTLRSVDFKDAVHVAREINDQPVAQGLAVGSRSAAARQYGQGPKRRLRQQTRNALEIFDPARIRDRLG